MAQRDTLYFNNNNRLVSKDKASWYRLPYVPVGEKYKITDYYMNGALMAEGYSRSADSLIWDGPFKSYYKNGRKFGEGNYMNGYQVGAWKTYYEDTDKLWVLCTYNLVSDTVRILRSFYKSGKIKRIEYNVKDKQPAGVCFNEDREEIPFTPYHTLASFKGDVNMFLGQNIRYPDDAREAKAGGRLMVVFTVDENGELHNIHCADNFLFRSLNEEAIRVVGLSSGLWNPALLDDKPYETVCNVPVMFVIE